MGGALYPVTLNLLAGARLALFRSVGREDFVVERRQVPLLLLATLAATWLGQGLLASPERPESSFALTYAITATALLVVSTWIVVSVVGLQALLTPALIVLAAPLPLLSLVLALMSSFAAPPQALPITEPYPFVPAILTSSLIALWQIAVTFRAVRLIFAFPPARTLALTAFLIFTLAPLGIMKSMYYYDTEEAQARIEAQEAGALGN